MRPTRSAFDNRTYRCPFSLLQPHACHFGLTVGSAARSCMPVRTRRLHTRLGKDMRILLRFLGSEELKGGQLRGQGAVAATERGLLWVNRDPCTDRPRPNRARITNVRRHCNRRRLVRGERGGKSHRLDLPPRLSVADHRQNRRILLEKTAPEILARVFRD